MTHDEKIEYLAIALNICNFAYNKRQVDLMVRLYDMVLEKGGGADMFDIATIKAEHNKKYKAIDKPTPLPRTSPVVESEFNKVLKSIENAKTQDDLHRVWEKAMEYQLGIEYNDKLEELLNSEIKEESISHKKSKS